MIEYFRSLEMIRISEPYWLISLISLPVIAWYIKKASFNTPTLIFSLTSKIKSNKFAKPDYSLKILKSLRYFSLFLILFSVARPQFDKSTTTILSSGTDIVLAIDISGSMLAEDMTEDPRNPVTRLDVVKSVILDFITIRKHDRIGIAAFSEYPWLGSPITLDKNYLADTIKDALVVDPYDKGTSIVEGITQGTNMLCDLKSKTKIIILLTDGVDSVNPIISPLKAAKSAFEEFGIKTYTIAIGKKGSKEPVDKETLKKIAELTDAKFYEAQNKETLKSIYDEIDQLEKTDVKLSVNALYDELYQWPLALGIILLLLEFFLAKTVFLRIP
jgi:Ca-activated chloride channel family protein